MELIAAVVIAVALVWAGTMLVKELRAIRREAREARTVTLLNLFAAGIAAANENPRVLLAWQPLVAVARSIFPEEFARLDRAAGAAFPFSLELIRAAHARWTTDWLTWERAHDAEFKLKAAAAEREFVSSGGGAVERARLDTVEREKLELYQRHYEEYIRIAKALQGLIDRPVA